MRSVRSEGARAAWRIASQASADDTRFDAEAADIAAVFRVKLANLRRYLRPRDIAAAVRALREEKQAAVRALRERRAARRQGEREERQQVRGPPTMEVG